MRLRRWTPANRERRSAPKAFAFAIAFAGAVPAHPARTAPGVQRPASDRILTANAGEYVIHRWNGGGPHAACDARRGSSVRERAAHGMRHAASGGQRAWGSRARGDVRCAEGAVEKPFGAYKVGGGRTRVRIRASMMMTRDGESSSEWGAGGERAWNLNANAKVVHVLFDVVDAIASRSRRVCVWWGGRAYMDGICPCARRAVCDGLRRTRARRWRRCCGCRLARWARGASGARSRSRSRTRDGRWRPWRRERRRCRRRSA